MKNIVQEAYSIKEAYLANQRYRKMLLEDEPDLKLTSSG